MPAHTEIDDQVTAGPADHQPPEAGRDTPAAESWRLRLDDSLWLHVPPRLASRAAYMLLEQEAWPGVEHAFATRLVGPDEDVLDIGAGYGAFSLAAGLRLRTGRVIAFEPSAGRQAHLMRSVLDNQLADRVAIAPLGLSDEACDTELPVPADAHDQPSARRGAPTEPVRLERMDDFMARHATGRPVGLVRLGAGGSAARALRGGEALLRAHSPVVIVDLQSKASSGDAAHDLLERLGYRLWRHLPGLDMLVPLPETAQDTDAPAFAFALKPDRAATLAAQGLLTDGEDRLQAPEALSNDETAAARRWLEARPCFAAGSPEGHPDPACDLLACVHARPDLPAPVRLARAQMALDHLLATLEGRTQGLDAGLVSTTVHALHLLGRRGAAVALARRALAHWSRDAAVAGTFLPPLLRDLERPRTGDLREWVRLVLGEYIEQARATTSCDVPCDPLTLRRLLWNPDHAVQMECRYALGEFRQNRVPDVALLPNLRQGVGTAHGALWQAVLGDETLAALTT